VDESFEDSVEAIGESMGNGEVPKVLERFTVRGGVAKAGL